MKKMEDKYIRVLRKCQNTSGFVHMFYRYLLHRLSLKTQIQIPYTTHIGERFSIGHLGRVIINPESILGNNVTINTGVVIGQENRGKRKGCPKIGNDVWIGPNSAIVGKINIGNDVLIAPNSFVNTDVPDHSVVVGNPAKIHYKEKATEGYLKY